MHSKKVGLGSGEGGQEWHDYVKIKWSQTSKATQDIFELHVKYKTKHVDYLACLSQYSLD